MAFGNFSSKIRMAEQVYGLQGGRIPKRDELETMVSPMGLSRSFLDVDQYEAPTDVVQDVRKLSKAMLGDPRKTSPFAEPLMGFTQQETQVPLSMPQSLGMDVETPEGKSKLLQIARTEGCLEGNKTPREIVQCVSEVRSMEPEDTMDMLEKEYDISFTGDKQEKMNIILDVILEMNKNKLPKGNFPQNPQIQGAKKQSNISQSNLPLRYQSFGDMNKTY